MSTMLQGVGDRMGYRIGNGAGFVMPGTPMAGDTRRVPSSTPWNGVSSNAHGNRLPVRVVSSSQLMREALAALLRQQPAFEVGTAAPDAIQRDVFIPASAREITVLDYAADASTIVDLTRILRRLAPSAGVIVFGIPREHSLLPFVDAGICGFVMQGASGEELVATIGSVAAGRPLALPSARSSMLPAQPSYHHAYAPTAGRERDVRLTSRERQICSHIVDGLCNKEIAAALNITLHTVKSHVHNLLTKLSVDSRLALAACIRRGVISLDVDHGALALAS